MPGTERLFCPNGVREETLPTDVDARKPLSGRDMGHRSEPRMCTSLLPHGGTRDVAVPHVQVHGGVHGYVHVFYLYTHAFTPLLLCFTPFYSSFTPFLLLCTVSTVLCLFRVLSFPCFIFPRRVFIFPRCVSVLATLVLLKENLRVLCVTHRLHPFYRFYLAKRPEQTNTRYRKALWHGNTLLHTVYVFSRFMHAVLFLAPFYQFY